MKKFISVLFVTLLLALCVMPAVSAADTQPDSIYFYPPTDGDIAWKNYSTVYCHIWSKLGGDIYGWQEKDERCENVGGGYWRYDLSGIEFDPEGEYSLIFSNENGMQTYNLNITSACLGDIATCAGDSCANPVDGEKSCAVARWMNNGEQVHPAIEIDSNGHTLNADQVNPEEAVTVWGSDAGASYPLPEVAPAEDKDDSADEEIADEETTEADGEDTLLIAPSPDAADNADGINTNAATVWIIIVCAVVACAVVVTVVILAKKNKK